MGLLKFKADAPETAQVTAGADGQKLRLHFASVSKEAIGAMAATTSQAGGWVEPSPAKPKVGDKMPDGTIYAGISPDTNMPMYAMPADAPLTMTFNEAKEYGATLDAHGYHDWRVPTTAELSVLFNNRAAIGGFTQPEYPNAYPKGWYWSASRDHGRSAWAQQFSDGFQFNFRGGKQNRNVMSLRCIR